MLTAQMPALTRALSGVLPPAALKQLTQSLGNCNQEMVHRGPIAVAPDAWQNINNRNGTYGDFPPSIDEYNNFYNNVVNQGDYSNTLSISNPFYNNVTNLGDIIFTTGGPAGRDGRDGLDGLTGIDGINGRDGREGSDGRDGQAGPSGAPGDPGAAGANGRDGRDGVGVRGADGAEGAAGAPGAPGVAGQNGRDGRDGVANLRTSKFVTDVQWDTKQLKVTPRPITATATGTIDPETCALTIDVTLDPAIIYEVEAVNYISFIKPKTANAYAPQGH